MVRVVVSSANKLVGRTGLGSRTLPRYPSRTVGLRRLIYGCYCFAAREQGLVLPPAFWANIAAAINAKSAVCITISAPVRNFSTRLLCEEQRTELTQRNDSDQSVDAKGHDK